MTQITEKELQTAFNNHYISSTRISEKGKKTIVKQLKQEAKENFVEDFYISEDYLELIVREVEQELEQQHPLLDFRSADIELAPQSSPDEKVRCVLHLEKNDFIFQFIDKDEDGYLGFTEITYDELLKLTEKDLIKIRANYKEHWSDD